ncbi:MAG TPA: hypothetical protein VJ246_00095 [Patescibacteria group bacterium]|nr:hypothetical protein [Patescibacteria group bacterium]
MPKHRTKRQKEHATQQREIPTTTTYTLPEKLPTARPIPALERTWDTQMQDYFWKDMRKTATVSLVLVLVIAALWWKL